MADETLRRLVRLLGLENVAVYGDRVRLRQDDLLVRTRASGALADAATALRDLAARYHSERIPASTREQPFPPAQAMAALRAIEQRERTVQDLEVQLRSAPFPPEDAVWERLRSARLQLDLLIGFDVRLIEGAQNLQSLSSSLSLEALDGTGAFTPLDDAVAQLRKEIAERNALLSAPPL